MLYGRYNVFMKITKQQQIKLMRKANRELALEMPRIKTGAHKTSKRDKQEKVSNTVRKQDYEQS